MARAQFAGRKVEVRSPMKRSHEHMSIVNGCRIVPTTSNGLLILFFFYYFIPELPHASGTPLITVSSHDEGEDQTGQSTSTRLLNGTGQNENVVCRLCHVTFDSVQSLDIHLHCDHISMRDGTNFKCPRAHCERVYPTRENLRAHLLAHYTMPMSMMGANSFGILLF